MNPDRTRALWLAACALWMAAPASAESGVRLAHPRVRSIPAATYDTEGQRVGGATLVIEQIEGGNVLIRTETGVEGGARSQLRTELQPIDAEAVRPLWQESRSFRSDGTPLGIMRVDHRLGVASCTSPGDVGEPDRIELALPDPDRVVNVPLHLLFEPLVRGEAQTVEFQFFLCGEKARLIDFEASVASRRNGGPKGRHLVEIRFGPDFGAFGSLLLKPMLPRLRVWFDPEAQQPWLGHRYPLYTDGPEVLVVRDGVPPSWLRP